MKSFLGLIVLLTFLFAFVSFGMTADAPPMEHGVVITCKDIFTFGNVQLESTTFSGNTTLIVLSVPRTKISFSSKDNGCWKFLGSNDRPKKKERASTE